ncbi:MAG: hypothetical protein IKW27_01665 [Bacteroidales bacterium]|nr:hypothetical protein [Bacteroidales bacterium]
MKKYIGAFLMMFVAVAMSAQAQSQDFERKYNLLVSKGGLAGVGVETLLENWEKADSLNETMLAARFDYYFTKAQSSDVLKKTSSKYLGMDPILTIKDSLGTDICYFQVSVFDDELYGEALRAVDKAIAAYPKKLEFRFMKANAYVAYEKESPDMALVSLLALADEVASSNGGWEYEGAVIDPSFFPEAIQEYCYTFFNIGTPSSYEAFKVLSEKMMKLYPDNIEFLNNIGSYHLSVKKDYKSALKCYAKVLKSRPDDYIAIRNASLAARRMGNVKQEIKYLELLAQYGTEKDRMLANARLDSLKK